MAAGIIILPIAICLTMSILAVIKQVMKRAAKATNLNEKVILKALAFVSKLILNRSQFKRVSIIQCNQYTTTTRHKNLTLF